MKMTDVERITLIRFHEILSVLKPKEAKEHQLAVQLLREGFHEDLYEAECASFLSDPFPAKDQKLVYEILDLHAALARSYKALEKKDKKAIDKDRLRFPGFDGATEAAHQAFAKFVIKKQGRWSDLDHKGDFDAQAPMLAHYGRMLSEARKLKSDRLNFTVEELKRILDAGIDPSPRKPE
jgi:uncharacterized protein YfbU (UPF0304 family)